MKVYGILVKFKNGSYNINQAFKTFNEAKKSILDKIAPGALHKWFDDDYNYFDFPNKIMYEIKEIDLEEE